MTAAPGSRSTIIELHRSAVAQLKRSRLVYGHGTHNPRDEAACLLAHAVGLPPAELSGHSAQVVTSLQQRRFDRLVARRVKERIPAPYLTRQAWLGDFSFYVDRRVIVPRSFIAELLRDGLDIWMKDPVRRVLDLCTGSGCLAILAAHAFPRARVDATDVSLGALAVARRNVLQYRLSRRVCLVNSNLFEALAGRRYDLILSNPPYVTAASMRALPREYRHEPRLALAGGPDGLALVRRILAGARNHLARGGVLVCEIGHNRRLLERRSLACRSSGSQRAPERTAFSSERKRSPQADWLRGTGARFLVDCRTKVSRC